MTTSYSPLRLIPTGVDPGVRELLAIREIAHALLTVERPVDVFQFALDRVTPLVGATFGCVYLIDGTSDVMRLAAAHNWPERYARVLGEMRVRLGGGARGTAARDRRPVEVRDVFADQSLTGWHETARELGYRSLVALPLQTKTKLLGTVTFYFSVSGAWSNETRHLLRAVADQMAATAEKAALIDDLRRANAALVDSNQTLDRQYRDLLDARRLKDEFLANISHELRTPLTAVIGYISLMEEGMAGPITPEQEETLAEVKASSEQLLALIGDLLELTMLRQGQLNASVSDFDARDALSDAVASLGKRAGSVSLDVAVPDHAVMMASDRRKIVKVLGGVLNNAFKFTHE